MGSTSQRLHCQLYQADFAAKRQQLLVAVGVGRTFKKQQWSTAAWQGHRDLAATTTVDPRSPCQDKQKRVVQQIRLVSYDQHQQHFKLSGQWLKELRHHPLRSTAR